MICNIVPQLAIRISLHTNTNCMCIYIYIYTYIYILLGVQSYHLLPKREASWQAMWNTFGWWFIVASKIKLGGSCRYSIHFRHDRGIISLDMYIYSICTVYSISIYIYIWFFIFRASLGGWYPTFPNTVCSDIWHVQFLFGGPRLPPPWLRHDMDSFLGGWGQRQTHVSGYFREGTHHWVIYSQYHKNKKHTHTTCIYLKTCIYINIYLWKYTFYPCALEKNIHTLHLQTSPNQLRCRQVSCSRGQSGFFQGCLLRFAQPRAAPRDNFAGFGVDLHRAPPGPRGQSL